MQRIFYNNAKSPILRELEQPRIGAWIHLETHDKAELHAFAGKYDLDHNLLLDGVDPNESPRIEQDGDKTYIYTRYSLGEKERLTSAPLLIILTSDNVITVSRRSFEGLENLVSGNQIITSKRTQLVLQILNIILNGFKLRINQISRQVSELRAQFSRAHIANENFASFIDIEEDLTDFLFVLEPMGNVLTTLLNGRFIRLYEDDRDLVEDLLLNNAELTQLANSRLRTTRNIREAYTAIVTNNLNKIFKRLTSIAIFISLVNVVTGFYGMNIDLPGAHHWFSFWLVLGLIAGLILAGMAIFSRKKWL